MPGARKGSVQIRFEILEHLYYNSRPQPRTHVWRKATTLSYDDFQKHVAYLVERGYLTESEAGLEITVQGRDVYDRLKNALGTLL
jgi:predicted transcriptional regulator